MEEPKTVAEIAAMIKKQNREAYENSADKDFSYYREARKERLAQGMEDELLLTFEDDEEEEDEEQEE